MRRAGALISPLLRALLLLWGTGHRRRGGNRSGLADGRGELSRDDGLFCVGQRKIDSALHEFLALVDELELHGITVREALLLRRKFRVRPPSLDDIWHI